MRHVLPCFHIVDMYFLTVFRLHVHTTELFRFSLLLTPTYKKTMFKM